jgi:iron complex outermembrane recepter protein
MARPFGNGLIGLGSLALLGFVLLQGAAGPAAAEQEQELVGEELVLTATRLADMIQDLRRVPGQVYVVTSQDIERTKPGTVQEAIRQVPGLVVYDSNGNSFQPTVDLRGFNAQPAPSVSVFVDGVRVNEPDSNIVNFDLIPIQDVERIEVLPGASAVFGRNSLGGVINIITKRGAATPQTTVEGAVGSYHHYRLSGNTSGSVKAVDYYFGVVQDRESGFRDFSDGRLTRFTGRLGFRPTEATDLSVSYNYANDSLEQAGTLRLSDLTVDRRRNISPVDVYANELSAVTFNGRQKLGLGFSVAGNAYFRQTSLDSRVVGLTSISHNVTDTNTTGGALQLSHDLAFWGRHNRLSVGGEIQHGGVNIAGDGTFSGFPFNSHTLVDEDALGAFVQDTLDILPELSLTGAVRYDTTKMRFEDEIASANNGERRYSRWTPRAGITYTPWPVLTLYGNYGEGFRVPTSTELFGFGVGFSDPNLRPVTSRTYEAGLRVRPFGWMEAKTAVFLTDVKDEIVFDPLAPPFGQNRNSPTSRRQGVELEMKFRPHAMIDVATAYTYTDARFRNGATILSGVVEKGDRVPLVPIHRVTASLTVRPLDGLTIGLDGQYVSRQVLLNDEPNLRPERVQDYYVLNARASYRWKWFTWFIQGNNLTDNKYETYGILSSGDVFVMPAPGINVLGGVTMRFENYY